MWLCRQIPKHKITDISKRRNQARKQNKRNPPLSAVGCTHSGDEAKLVNTNKSKTKMQTKEKFQPAEIWE
jgi:hypothetical protein